MSKGKWNDGPPPAVGWWPASHRQVFGSYRWWDGKQWSIPAWRTDSAEQAGECAAVQAFPFSTPIRWRYWSKGRAMP